MARAGCGLRIAGKTAAGAGRDVGRRISVPAASASFEHSQEARSALRAIAGDPAYGTAALDNPRTLAGLLSDLLPDAPRESGLLLVAAEKNVPAALRDHVRHGMNIGTAISLTASSLAASTAYGRDVCEWVTIEFAIALGLATAEQLAADPQPAAGRPDGAWPTAATDPAAAPAQHLPTETAFGHPAGTPETHPPFAAQMAPPTQPHTLPRPRPRRRPGVVAILGSAVIIALALAGYALFRVSANGSSAAGAPPVTSTPVTSAPGSSTSPSTSPPPVVAGAAPATWGGIWVAQLDSVKVSSGRAALSSTLAKIRLAVPGAQVLTSTNYASLVPNYWVIYYAGGFSDGTEALRFCATRGRTTGNKCLGRYVSHEAADGVYQCYPPVSAPTGNCLHQPASAIDVVESYLTAISLRDWPEAWQLGGKNLGQSYGQMIAGYRQTSRILISHLASNGDAVSVRTLAYESDGALQKYALSYNVQDGVIVAGQSTLISTG
jgi:hypothetical protein